MGEVVSANRSRRRRGTTARARKLRQGGNRAEALLWLELKNRKLGGHRFTRQLPIGPYFADFACREKWLVVEVDGSQHAESSRDRIRDNFMQSQGYSVLRFWNTDVLKLRSAVCETILAALSGRLSANIEAQDLRFVVARTAVPPVEHLTLSQRVVQSDPHDSSSSNLDITS
ncbi:endonuclease domain-containing protein [Mesorhizobium sp. CC13]|uniref:endonuclease domain-containing protein n=1 Tax=Mesorhizobium sp. CC13 TaxID=3029194 RepID=UPI00326679B5